MTTTPIPDPFVVAICYQSHWWTEPGAFDEAVAQLESITTPDGGRVEVVLAPYEEDHERRSARGADPSPDWAASQPEIDPQTLETFGRMHAALALDLPAGVVDLAPELQIVQAFGAGSDQFLSCDFDKAGVKLVSSAGSNAIGIAEFCMGRVLEFYKRFEPTRDLQRQKLWKPQFGSEVAGKTVGLLGFGNICAAIAPRARAFDMRVLACRQSAKPGDTDPALDGVYPAADLHEMLGESDVVIAAVPRTPETDGLMDAAAFAAMKEGAFFINVGRGTLVVEPDLVAALESGHLGGAALDVASSEPPADDNPIWDAPRLSMSFHNAAVPAAMFGNVHRIFEDNVRSFVNATSMEG